MWLRELKNVMERVIILAVNDLITSDLLPIGFHNTHESGSMEMQQVEKNHIQKLLIFTKGNKAQTSRLLEIGLTTLYRKIEEYKLN